jgi:hypothetical protein
MIRRKFHAHGGLRSLATMERKGSARTAAMHGKVQSAHSDQQTFPRLMRTSCEEDFRPQAERYRRRIRLFLALIGFAVLMTAAAAFGPASWTKPFGIPGTALMFVALVTIFTRPRLLCPCCRKAAESFDRFCPICGAEGLRRYQITVAKCDECGRTLGQYKYRNYVIRFCTYCGALLDRRGV